MKEFKEKAEGEKLKYKRKEAEGVKEKQLASRL